MNEGFVENSVNNVNNLFDMDFKNRVNRRFFDTFFKEKLFPQRFSHFLTELLTLSDFIGQTLRQLKNKTFVKKRLTNGEFAIIIYQQCIRLYSSVG